MQKKTNNRKKPLIHLAANWIALALLSSLSTGLMAANADPYQNIVNTHYKNYAEKEYFSGIQVSVKAGTQRKDYVAGKISHDENAPRLTANHLFQIGSITKSFTAVLALKAEEKNRIKLKHTINRYLPQYTHWGQRTITQLLNMTSGLPNYSDSGTMNYRFAHQLDYKWKPSEMMDLVYTQDFNPPLITGYAYTNTGYILMDMILGERTQKSFSTLIKEEIIDALPLENSFYPLPALPPSIEKRLISGYGYNVYDNPELVGRDIRKNDLSWGGAAGAMLSNSADVIQWAEAIFIQDKLLTNVQKKQMQQMVSTETGEPIAQTNAENPHGFGLGIIQSYNPKIGRFWFYEGQTLGFRAFYMYVPCKQAIISALFNSATNAENDHGSHLMMALYQEALKQNPDLPSCI